MIDWTPELMASVASAAVGALGICIRLASPKEKDGEIKPNKDGQRPKKRARWDDPDSLTPEGKVYVDNLKASHKQTVEALGAVEKVYDQARKELEKQPSEPFRYSSKQAAKHREIIARWRAGQAQASPEQIAAQQQGLANSSKSQYQSLVQYSQDRTLGAFYKYP